MSDTSDEYVPARWDETLRLLSRTIFRTGRSARPELRVMADN